MKIETTTNTVQEIEVDGHGLLVTATVWPSNEGITLVVADNGNGDCRVRMAGLLRWEEADMLVAAIVAARSAE